MSLISKKSNHSKRPEGWEIKETIIDEQDNVLASVIFWPWSNISCEKADEILAEQVRSHGRNLSEVESVES